MKIWIEDITHDQAKLSVARRLVVDAYGRFRNETVEDQPPLKFNNQITFAALNSNAEVGDDDWMLGTFSLNFGSCHSSLQLKEIFKTVAGTWSEFKEHGFDDSRVAEVSRLAFSGYALKHPERKTLLSEVFFRGLNAIHLASNFHGCNQIWAVASAFVVNNQKYIPGVKFLPAAGVEFDPPDEWGLPKYKNFRPKLYRLIFNHSVPVGKIAERCS